MKPGCVGWGGTGSQFSFSNLHFEMFGAPKQRGGLGPGLLNPLTSPKVNVMNTWRPKGGMRPPEFITHRDAQVSAGCNTPRFPARKTTKKKKWGRC